MAVLLPLHMHARHVSGIHDVAAQQALSEQLRPAMHRDLERPLSACSGACSWSRRRCILGV